MKHLPLSILPILVLLSGCVESAARKATTASFDQAKIEAKRLWDEERPKIVAEAKLVAAEKLDDTEKAINSGLDARIAAATAKRDSGQPLTPGDWFLIALGASGLGASGVSAGKAALRKLLGIKPEFDHAPAVAAMTNAVKAALGGIDPTAVKAALGGIDPTK